MKFLVLMAEEDTWGRWNALSDSEQQAVFDRFTAFTEAVKQRGAVLAGEALDRPESARTIRPVPIASGPIASGSIASGPLQPGTARPVTEGPFAETVEQLGGFWLVDLPDLDSAVEVARLLPDAYSVEVRPIVDLDD